jgi:hypothetical protein
MSWHKLADNQQALETLYQTVPELEDIELFSLNLNREGSQLQIQFDLPSFPDNPSARWNENFNTLQIQLSFWGITNFEAKGWQENMKVKIDIKSHNKVLEVSITNSEIDLRFIFLSKFLRIDKISPYQKEQS